MAYQKLQAREALHVIPDANVPIPDPNTAINLISTSVAATDGVTAFQVAANGGGTFLTGTNTKFTEMNIPVGAIIYNPSAATPECYFVVSVDSDTQITVNKAVAGGASDAITIYTKATVGCTLYIGTAGDVTVQMAEINGNTVAAAAPANAEVTYKNVGNAGLLPIQVRRVDNTTTADHIVAMW